MRVRDATEDDVPAILGIHTEVFRTSDAIWRDEPETFDERRAWFRSRVDSGWPVLVATTEDGNVAGFASFGPFRSFPGYRFTVEHTIHLGSAHRSVGVGTALLRALLDRARAMGMQEVVAAIDGSNTGSVRFHARFGFEQVGYLPRVGRKDGRPVDLVLMQLHLTDDAGAPVRAAPVAPPSSPASGA